MFKLCWLSSVSVFASAVTGLRETEWRVLGDIWKRVRPTSVIQHRKCSDIHTQEATCPHLILSTLPSGMRRNCIRLFAVIPRILVGQCSKKDFWSPLFLIYGQCRNIVCRHAVNLTHNVPFVKTYVIKISVWTLDWTLDWFDSDGEKKTSLQHSSVFWLDSFGVLWFPSSYMSEWRRPLVMSQHCAASHCRAIW